MNGRLSCVVGAAAMLLLAGAAPPAAAAGPSIDVTVEGTTLSNGGSVVVTEDPSVTVDVTAESSLESVSIRVDGETRESFSPGSTSFSETVTLDLKDGDHDLRVIASGNDTTTLSGTVTKDSTGPRASYTSPFTTDKNRPPDVVDVSTAEVTLAADLYDTTGVSEVSVEWRYDYTFAGQSETARDTYRIDDPGDAFSQQLLLGTGENEVKILLTDEQGQVRRHQTVIDVRDEERPSIRVQTVERPSDGEKLRIAGVVADNVKVNSLKIKVGDESGSTTIIRPTDKEPEEKRLSMEFETTVTAGENVDSVTLTADDVDGNERTKEVPLDYERRIEPSISIEEVQPVDDGAAVAVSGTVSKGEITSVSVETAANGEVIDLKTVYDGDVTGEVTVEERLKAAGTGTVVRVRALDSNGEEHVASVELGADGGGSSGETATPDGGTQTAATSSPTASDGGGGDAGDAGGGGDSGAGDPTPTPTPTAASAPFLSLGGPGLLVAALTLVVAFLVVRRRVR